MIAWLHGYMATCCLLDNKITSIFWITREFHPLEMIRALYCDTP